MKIDLIAHRCGTDKFPEQTLEAARYSMEIGADYVEMDIRFTKDNNAVISHDSTALKMFGNPSKINTMTLKKFLALRYSQDPQYESKALTGILSSGVGPILFHIKEGGERLFTIIDIINAYHYQDRVILGVISASDARAAKTYGPNIPVLAFSPNKGTLREFADNGADILRLWESWITREDIAEIHSMSKKVWIMAGQPFDGLAGYTNDKNLKDWVKMGVDGILVNEVSKAKRILGS